MRNYWMNTSVKKKCAETIKTVYGEVEFKKNFDLKVKM